MSVLPTWPVLGSMSLMVVVLSMSVGALLAHVRDVVVHGDRRGLRALAVFGAEVVLLASVLILSDFSWLLVLAVAGVCAGLERLVLHRRHGHAPMISKTRFRSAASGASNR